MVNRLVFWDGARFCEVLDKIAFKTGNKHKKKRKKNSYSCGEVLGLGGI